MLSKAEFASLIADAYKHVYDLVYLRTHPALDILVPSATLSGKKRTRRLHQILLEVIEELDPGPLAPTFTNEWRRHRLMLLRYVRGLSPQAVADQLAIGLRHYYRVHEAAIEDVASLLWDRYVARQPPPAATHAEATADTAAQRLELLRLETARVAQSDRYARLGDVIHGSLPLLTEMLSQHQIQVDLLLSEPLEGVSMGKSLLRQLLLAMLGYLVEHARQGTLRLEAHGDESLVHLSLLIDPLQAVQPPSSAEAQEQLSEFAEMAAVSGARILPVQHGQVIVGFEVQLPTIERTVLVVDDNQDILELFRGYLSPHRYRIVTAQTAQEALTLARQLQPYAITLDLMMPMQDGWDLLQVLLNQPETRPIPIIVCSVLKQKELALSLGASVFLEKPVSEEALVAGLEAVEQV